MTKSSENMDDKSSFGLKPNIAAILPYALVLIISTISGFIIGFKVGEELAQYGNHPPDRVMLKIQIASLGYGVITWIITLGAGFIFFVMEKESRFVRLHSMQAILFYILNLAVSIIFSVMTMALGAGVAVISIPVSIVIFVVWILMMVKAYKGDILKLPVISDMAENIVTQSASTQPVTPRTESAEKMKTCPECAESIKDAAKSCRFCGHKFSEAKIDI